jgi:hypothetical protein
MRTKTLRNFLLIAMVLLVNLVFTQFTNASVTGPGSSWQYCRRITLSPVTTATNFQVKIVLSTATLGNPYSNIKTDGSDLRFYDINNNLCNYWIENWTNTGNSTIWVKVPVSGTTFLYMYYGNASATAASSGVNTFDFFDDFTTALGSNWTTITSGGSVIQSGSTVTLSNTNGGTVSLSNTSAFTPSLNSFFLETKHRDVGYNRNRFYATTSTGAGCPAGLLTTNDYGYFTSIAISQTTSKIYWNGTFTSSTLLSNNTDYLTSWQITDGSTYNWYTYNYATGAALDATARNTTYASNIRFISIMVTEVSNTSTIVDWVRVRKYTPTEPGANIGSQVTNLSANITARTNVLCNGFSTGAATVTATGGSGVYTYLWNSSPPQSTQIAINLPAGTFSATVTDNIGLTVTTSVTITQPVTAISASVDGQSNISCFAGSNGSITIRATGGTGPYNYSVDNGASWTPALPVLPNPYQYGGLNVANNPYRIKVKDNNGCISK